MPKLISVVAGLLLNAKRELLLTQRPSDKDYAHYWEFPGGKIDEGETPEEALERELLEEIGVVADKDHMVPFQFISHAYKDFHVLLLVFVCEKWSGEIALHEGQGGFVWVTPKTIHDYQLPEADLALLPRIIELML